MTNKEFLQRESALALRFGIRKTDVYYQLVRCTACGNEALLRNRYSGRVFSSVDEVEEEMLAQIQREIRASCVACDAGPLQGDGSRHVFLLYSERRAAHVAITPHPHPQSRTRRRSLRYFKWGKSIEVPSSSRPAAKTPGSAQSSSGPKGVSTRTRCIRSSGENGRGVPTVA